MLLPTGLYAGPPFGRAVAFVLYVLCGFYHPGLRPPLRWRGMVGVMYSCLATVYPTLKISSQAVV